MFKDTIAAKNVMSRMPGLDGVSDACNGCGTCEKECAFLSVYGNPGTIVNRYKSDPQRWHSISFECSLCGLCTSVCPKGLDPEAMFLEFRKNAVNRGHGNFPQHHRLLTYEKKGTSQAYTLYHLPENCDTIFFPGCTLAGTRPKTTFKAYDYLKENHPATGIVLDCCTKPSHDLGRQDFFNDMFSSMTSFLETHHIRSVIVACPNCYKIFNTYGTAFKVETIYDVMARCGIDDKKKVSGSVTIHDPCPIRFENTIQASVRSVVKTMGLDIMDTSHQGTKTYCCGEGGAAGCLAPGFASEWTSKSTTDAAADTVTSYCAGCVNLLSKNATSFHLLDLVFDPEKTMAGDTRVSKAPFTYLNRLLLKRKLKKVPVETIVERPFSALSHPRKKKGSTLFFFGIIIAAIAGIRSIGLF